MVAVQVRDHDGAHVAGRAPQVADGRADARGAAREAGVDEDEAAGGSAPAGGPRRRARPIVVEVDQKHVHAAQGDLVHARRDALRQPAHATRPCASVAGAGTPS